MNNCENESVFRAYRKLILLTSGNENLDKRLGCLRVIQNLPRHCFDRGLKQWAGTAQCRSSAGKLLAYRTQLLPKPPLPGYLLSIPSVQDVAVLSSGRTRHQAHTVVVHAQRRAGNMEHPKEGLDGVMENRGRFRQATANARIVYSTHQVSIPGAVRRYKP